MASVNSVFLWWFGLPLAVVAVSVAFRKRQDRLIATTGRHAIGHVLAVGCDDDGLGSSTYWVRVQYDYDGEPVTAKVGVRHRDRQRYRVGERAGLTYAPSRPQAFRLDSPEQAVPCSRPRPERAL